MMNYQFPINFSFKIGTLANDFNATDANGQTVAYVRQKMLKFIEEVVVYSNDSKTEVKYKIKANKWIDFSAAYIFTNANGEELGRIVRKGWASLWKARYEIYDKNQQQLFLIQEENGWVKVWDALIGEVPILSMFTGYLFNPKYLMKKLDETPIARLKKEPSFFGRRFSLNKLEVLDPEKEEVILLGFMMMILLERRRG
jgi:uncharacterized protein YxjI